MPLFDKPAIYFQDSQEAAQKVPWKAAYYSNPKISHRCGSGNVSWSVSEHEFCQMLKETGGVGGGGKAFRMKHFEKF